MKDSATDYGRLFEVARQAIEDGIKGRPFRRDDYKSDSGFTEPSGAFVSLFSGKDLRGCIGKLFSSEPMSILIAEMARAAAFSDPRFPPLSEKEYPEISVEISVLTPLRKIESIDEITIGKHGLYIKKQGRSGVLLPQVASSRGWSVLEFLQHTSDEKAGIGKDGWKEAEIFVFEAIILHER